MKLITKPRPPIVERMAAALERAQDQELEIEKFVLTKLEAVELGWSLRMFNSVKTNDRFQGVRIEVVE